MNILVVYFVESNDVVSKTEISWDDHAAWENLADLKNHMSLKSKKIKYFDDEKELISLTNNEDFATFIELVHERNFINNQVFLIVHEGVLNLKKFGRLENVLKLKVDDGCPNSFININSMISVSNSGQNSSSLKQDVDNDSMSSTSSSSIPVQRRKHCVDRHKKHQLTHRYEAILKKELNYMSGSEVSDGQTILKRWRIKNVGSKKWKENSVKCVLLPSEFSNWITYSPLKFPTCFADQKVDVEMEIRIKGLWDNRDSSSDQDFQDINLTWLLYKDKLLASSPVNFKDYILMYLELRMKVKPVIFSTEFQTNIIEHKELKKHLSESSIERVEQDFSIVNMSEEESDQKDHCVQEVTVSDIEHKLMKDDSDNMDIELPECPQEDNFQITDFNKPGDFISTEPKKESFKVDRKSDDHSILSLLNESNFVGKVVSSVEVLPTRKDIEDTIAQSLVGVKVKYGNFERLATNEEETNVSIHEELSLLTDIEEQNNVSSVYEKNASGKDSEERNTTPEEDEVIRIDKENKDKGQVVTENEKEKINESKDDEVSEDDEFIECNMNDFEVLKVDEATIHDEFKVEVIGRNLDNDADDDEIKLLKAELSLQFDSKVEESLIKTKESDSNFLSKADDNNMSDPYKGRNVPEVCLVEEVTNNVLDQNAGNIHVSRQKPIDTIKNDFARSNQPPTAPYQPGAQYPHLNHPGSYVAGTVQSNGLYRDPNYYYQQSPQPCYVPPVTYNNIPSSAYIPGVVPTALSQRGIYPGSVHPNSNSSQVMQITQVLQENSDKIIEDLRRGGHLHGHINDGPTLPRADNGQHYLMNVNLEKLKGMGFTDEERNRRLLAKFNNNINDVINDLID